MIKAISYIFKRPDLSNQEFLNHYETTHAPLARSILKFGYYERNHILNNDSNKLPSCISIFKYNSEEQLKKTQKTLENYPPDLKEDELKFMDFDKNHYYFVEEDVINDQTYPFKVFSDKRLDQIAIKLCSINKVYDKKTEIYEYGCEVDLSVNFNDSEIFFCRNFT